MVRGSVLPVEAKPGPPCARPHDGCGIGGCPTAAPLPWPSPSSSSCPDSTAGREGCDPSYPTVCIPPSPPDLDCADITHRSFPVLPPDPHRFDGGGDGLGCER